MATLSVSINFTTPAGMTAAQFVAHATESMGYDSAKADGETRTQFFRRMLARYGTESARSNRIKEAVAAISVPDDITHD